MKVVRIYVDGDDSTHGFDEAFTSSREASSSAEYILGT
jgi:hypothetical protein